MDSNKIRKIVCIYFTTFPYEFYDEANRSSNFALSGIGSGLIEAQRDFWVSNCSLLFIIFYKNNISFIIIYFFLNYVRLRKIRFFCKER